MCPGTQDALIIEGKHILVAPGSWCSPLVLGSRLLEPDLIDPDPIPSLRGRYQHRFSQPLLNLLLGGAVLRRFQVEGFLGDEQGAANSQESQAEDYQPGHSEATGSTCLTHCRDGMPSMSLKCLQEFPAKGDRAFTGLASDSWKACHHGSASGR